VSVGQEEGWSNPGEEDKELTAIKVHVGRGIGAEGGWRRSSAADIFQHAAKAGRRRVNSLQQEESHKSTLSRED
jgi:hypothetical protein